MDSVYWNSSLRNWEGGREREIATAVSFMFVSVFLGTSYESGRMALGHSSTQPIGEVASGLPPRILNSMYVHSPNHIGRKHFFDKAASKQASNPSLKLKGTRLSRGGVHSLELINKEAINPALQPMP